MVVPSGLCGSAVSLLLWLFFLLPLSLGVITSLLFSLLHIALLCNLRCQTRSEDRPMLTESVMPSHHLILCHPLLLLPSIFPSISVEVAGPLGTPLGLAQRKRASPRGEAGTSGFLCVSDSDRTCLFQFWFPRCVCPAVGLLGRMAVLFPA